MSACFITSSASRFPERGVTPRNAVRSPPPGRCGGLGGRSTRNAGVPSANAARNAAWGDEPRAGLPCSRVAAIRRGQGAGPSCCPERPKAAVEPLLLPYRLRHRELGTNELNLILAATSFRDRLRPIQSPRLRQIAQHHPGFRGTTTRKALFLPATWPAEQPLEPEGAPLFDEVPLNAVEKATLAP